MIFEKLRAVTAEIHKDIEKSNTIMNPAITRDQYVQYLLNILPFIENAEQEIFEHTDGHHETLSIAKRMKSSWIKNDIDTLGKPKESADSYKRYQLKNFSEALGALYVLEGSTLGGTVISRHLKTKLDLAHDQVSYFSGYGEKTGKMWSEFKSQVINTNMSFNDEDVIEGALKTFRKYNEVLQTI